MTATRSAEVAQSWPATPIQRWMATLDEADPTSGHYVLPFTWTVPGQVDWPAFGRAFRAVCDRHPVLRGAVRRGADGWVQEVLPHSEVVVDLLDATGRPDPADRQQLLEDSYERYCRAPFCLGEEPPIRVRLIQLEQEFLVFGAYHQAVCDIESMALFTAELWDLYFALAGGGAAPDPAPGPDFPAYAGRVRDAADRQVADNLGYWRDQLAGVPLRCGVPVDFPAAAADLAGPTEYIKIGRQPAALAAHALATAHRCSEYAVMMSAFALVLGRRAGERSVVVAGPVSQRRTADLFRVVGPLTELAWLRVDLPADGGLAEMLRPTLRSVLGALAHPCPIDVVARELGAGSAGPVLQCQYFPPERVAIPEWVEQSVRVTKVLPVPLLTGPLRSPFWFDLTIAGERVQADTDFSLTYRTDLFRPATAQAVADEIEQAVMAAAGALR